MAEVQKHGFDFENWVKETFFQSFTQTPPSHKWDALDVVYKSEFNYFTKNFSGLSVSIKTVRLAAPLASAMLLDSLTIKKIFF